MPTRRDRRAAFTLIELLVVIAIIAFLMGLTAFVLSSSLLTSQYVSQGESKVTGVLLGSKQMARSAGVPTGVRFNVGADNFCRSLTYIRQPEDVALGVYIGRVEADPYNLARISSSADLTDPGVFPVAAGDYLELYGGGVLRRLVNHPGTSSPVARENPNLPTGVYLICLAPPPPAPAVAPPPPTYNASDYTGIPLPLSPASPGQLNSRPNYRIIGAPRPISGEPAVELPSSIAIDFNRPSGGWNDSYQAGGVLSNPPTRGGYYEILFGPSGAVVGQNTGAGMIFLWLREARDEGGGVILPDNSSDRLAGKPLLIAIQTRTGFIASHEVRPAGDPYTFPRDGRASGL